MHHVSPPRNRSFGTYAAIVLFVAVYLGGLGLVLAPKALVGVQSGAATTLDE